MTACRASLPILPIYARWPCALNGRQSVEEFVSQLPLDRVWELHIAGGMEMDGFWLDAHSGAIPDAVMEAARTVVSRLPNLKAIIFEIFPSFIEQVGLDVVRAQLEKLRELWVMRPATAVPQARQAVRPSSHRRQGEGDTDVWEAALGRLVIGRNADTFEPLTKELSADRGVPLIRKLVKEFRGSMIVSLLRLTSRLLMLSLGKSNFLNLLEDFWSKTPPQFYSYLEANCFAAYLDDLGLRVPHLAAVVRFEHAVMHTMADDRTRVVTFEVDPIPLLRALAEGRLPDAPLQEGSFEIEVTPSILNAQLSDLDARSRKALGALGYH